MNTSNQVHRFFVKHSAMVKHKQCRSVGYNLMCSGGYYLRILITSDLVLFAINVIVSFDIVDVEKKVLEDEGKADQPSNCKNCGCK